MRNRRWLFLLLGMGLWLGLIGRVTFADVLLGVPVVVSAWVLYCHVSDPPQPRQDPGLWAIARYLLGYVAPEVLRSTVRVFGKVLSPRLALSPAIVAVKVPNASRFDLTLLAYGISLTPGQQIVDIDEAQGILYVHAMDAPDPDAVSAHILAVFRRCLQEEIA